MVDNVAITPGVGATVGADDIGGVLIQRVKTTWGPDGTANDADVATGKPLPIQVRSATGLVPLGEPTDAKNTATDTTSVSGISVWKQISASVQTVATGTPALGQTTQAGGVPIAIPSDIPTLPVAQTTQGFSASATFTPAASSHVGNDCNGAAAQFSFSPTPTSASHIMLTDVEFEIDGATAEASAWVLKLYNVTPPSATADDGAWDLVSGDRASFLGEIELGIAIDKGSTQWVETHGLNKIVKLSGTTVFGYLTNVTTQTPAAVAHIVKLYGIQV